MLMKVPENIKNAGMRQMMALNTLGLQHLSAKGLYEMEKTQKEFDSYIEIPNRFSQRLIDPDFVPDFLFHMRMQTWSFAQKLYPKATKTEITIFSTLLEHFNRGNYDHCTKEVLVKVNEILSENTLVVPYCSKDWYDVIPHYSLITNHEFNVKGDVFSRGYRAMTLVALVVATFGIEPGNWSPEAYKKVAEVFGYAWDE